MQNATRNAVQNEGARPALAPRRRKWRSMARLNIASLPRNDELFYEAVAGHNAALASDLAALGSHPHQAKLDALGLQHCLVSHCGIAAEAAGSEAGKLLFEAEEGLSDSPKQKRFSRAAETLLQSISSGDQGIGAFMSEMEYLTASLKGVLSYESELEAKLRAAAERIEALERGISAVQSASVTDALTCLPNRIALTKVINELTSARKVRPAVL